MTLLASVRKKYGTPLDRPDRTDKRCSGSIVSSKHSESEKSRDRERRRVEVLTELTCNPSAKYAYVIDATSDPVIVAMAIRGVASFEMMIQASRYDPFQLMQLLAANDRNAAGV